MSCSTLSAWESAFCSAVMTAGSATCPLFWARACFPEAIAWERDDLALLSAASAWELLRAWMSVLVLEIRVFIWLTAWFIACALEERRAAEAEAGQDTATGRVVSTSD